MQLLPPKNSDQPPSPELMQSIGRLIRGLSALFWGLPASLVFGVHLAFKNQYELRVLDFFFPVAANGCLLIGICLLSDFQKRERLWLQGLDRARVLSIVLVGLSPFLYWHVKVPEVLAFSVAVLMLGGFSLMFLYNLNYILQRLTLMLPDEALRYETQMFGTFNQYLLAAIPLCISVWIILVALMESGALPNLLLKLLIRSEAANQWIIVLLTLVPVASTMALLWKTKEVVFNSVFHSR